MFTYNDISYLLEFDGFQIISFGEFFHRSMKVFIEKQRIDLLKTKSAINEGYRVIC